MVDKKNIAAWFLNTATRNYTAAIILAAGNSTRMGENVNKQLQLLHGIPVLAHTLMAYQKCAMIREIVVVAQPKDFDAIYQMRKTYGIHKMTHIVAGGATRQESAKNGMSKLSDKVRYVAIADGARCLITPEQVAKVCLRAYRYQAASAAHQISDTVKRTNAVGMSLETVERKNLWQAQTPQVFHHSLYVAAMERAKSDGFTGTDDNALVEHLGYQVRMVECGRENIKITTAEDLPLAEAILTCRRCKK
jgi:2-C-methyl-D-erythritol 4-phosphate cytidylyltransferase